MIVSGTNIISDTSFVTNIEEKNTEKTRNMDNPVMVRIFPARRSKGRKIFSFLNPSKTVSIIKSVPRVLQSMSLKSLTEGGVIMRAARAAKTDTESMISFLINSHIFFTVSSPAE